MLFGGQSQPLELRGIHNQPGHYTSDVVPTQAGYYRFHITGALGGEAVDETFDSADGHFSEVESLSAIQFPAVATASEATARAPADQTLARAAGPARADGRGGGVYRPNLSHRSAHCRRAGLGARCGFYA